MERKSLGKRLRFEVLKRDSFKCQYCGKSAPEVILNIDHIKPVSDGGTDHIMNLVTSCFDCNSGKSDISLSDTSAMSKQKKQLDKLELERQQLELLFEWHESLKDVGDLATEKTVAYFNSKLRYCSLNEKSKTDIKRHIRKYSVSEVLVAIDECLPYYIQRAKEYAQKQKAGFERYHLKKMSGDGWTDDPWLTKTYSELFLEFDQTTERSGTELFLTKLSGVLRNKKKEAENPEYTVFVDLYRGLKAANNDYSFGFKAIERLFHVARQTLSLERCKQVFWSRSWESFEDFEDHVNKHISIDK